MAEGHAELLGAAGHGRRDGWVYRKDWFSKPELQAAFKKKYRRDLAPPKTWTELKEIAEFFQGREIDGKKVYGAAIFTERGSEGITMGVTGALYPYGLQVRRPEEALPHGRASSIRRMPSRRSSSTSRSTSAARRPGYTDAYMQEGLDAFKSGQVAMMMNWFAFFPGLYKDEKVGGDKIGFFVNPGQKVEALARSAARASPWSPTPPTRTTRCSTSSGSPQPEVQKKWWSLGGYSCHKPVLNDPGLPRPQPFAADFLNAMGEREGLLAGAFLCATAARHAEARA